MLPGLLLRNTSSRMKCLPVSPHKRLVRTGTTKLHGSSQTPGRGATAEPSDPQAISAQGLSGRYGKRGRVVTAAHRD